MATNEIFDPADMLSLVVSHPTTPTSSAPVRAGFLTGVAQTDEDSDGDTTVAIGLRVDDLSVKAVDDNGNSAVALYDPIFYVDADTPPLSKKATGYFFGYALETVTSGSTDTIRVLHVPSGSGTLGSGTVGATQLASSAVTTTKLAANAVTAAKLTSTLATGMIPLPLSQARIIATNDISAKGTPDGGLVSLDTDPTFKRVNAATDKKLRISWAAASVVEIQWDISYPPDLDDTAAVTVNIFAAMAGATNTPTIAVSYFEGVGDTNAGGNTAAVTGTTLTKYSVTIAASDIGAYPNGASIGLIPGSHGTDALHLYAAWVEYTRK